ncbi:MAG: LysR family transcriptional regulator [Rhizobiales bacterium]|nr:LysR family transcriptional regulator [Hyphomicrobiales bacterium]
MAGPVSNTIVAKQFTKVAECDMFDWNDIRFFLSVARQGTTLAASRELKVSQSTVARRIVAMEAALGLELFDKRQSGYVLSEKGDDIRAEMEAAEACLLGIEARASSLGRDVSGIVRVTTNDLFASGFLIGAIKAFQQAYPGIKLDIVTSDRLLDLAAGEADIAIRAGRRPTEPNLVGRQLAVDTWSLYCGAGYAARHGVPRNIEELAQHRIIGADPGAFAGPHLTWVEKHVRPDQVVLRQNSIPGLYAMIRNDLGISFMSDFFVAGDPQFVCCFTPDIAPYDEIWLVTHERLRHVPRVRAVLDFLAGQMSSRMRQAAV